MFLSLVNFSLLSHLRELSIDGGGPPEHVHERVVDRSVFRFPLLLDVLSNLSVAWVLSDQAPQCVFGELSLADRIREDDVRVKKSLGDVVIDGVHLGLGRSGGDPFVVFSLLAACL